MTRAALLVALTLSVAIFVHGQKAVALGDKVEAASCAIANSGSASGNSVTCNFGLTPEQLKQATEAAVKGATGPLIDRVADISKTLGVTDDAAKTLLKIVGDDPNIPDDKLAEALTKVARDYNELQTQVSALNPVNPRAQGLVQQAKLEIRFGNLDRAEELLHDATEAQVAAAQEARKLREQAQAAEDAGMVGAASSKAAEGDLALTKRRYARAAELFALAAKYVPFGDLDQQSDYLLREGDALYEDGALFEATEYEEGMEGGTNSSLNQSVEVYRLVIEKSPRERVPQQWAYAQHQLGRPLYILGSREADPTALEESVAVSRAALEEWPRIRFPHEWAVAEKAIGLALEELGSANVKVGDCGIASSGTATGNIVNCGSPPAPPAPKP
jgi:hypothetical protein